MRAKTPIETLVLWVELSPIATRTLSAGIPQHKILEDPELWTIPNLMWL
jgi:hypothetical protein